MKPKYYLLLRPLNKMCTYNTTMKVFNVLFVIAACAFASAKALDLTAWPLIRDTSFYSTALLLLVVFFRDDTIEWYEALILFILYFSYVAFMKFNGRFEKKAEIDFFFQSPNQLHIFFGF